VESFQEFRVDMANNTAEYGGIGQVTIVSKGGSNDFNGSLFDYYSMPGSGHATLSPRNGLQVCATIRATPLALPQAPPERIISSADFARNLMLMADYIRTLAR
jgi:hypothetical protein